MGRAPKPTRLEFGVRTAKRRAQPNQFNVTLKMEHNQCLKWYEYIHSEMAKIAQLVESQAYPPGCLIGAEQPQQVEAVQPTTTTEEV
jgi:hypothetical protein